MFFNVMSLSNKNTLVLFYDVDLGYPVKGLPFYGAMYPEERKYHVADSLINEETPLDIFFQVLNRKILKWQKNLRNAIEYAIFLVEKKLGEKIFWEFILMNSSDKYNKWNFICSSSDLEFGLPHTNADFIFIPAKYIQECIDNNDYIKLAKTCFHEKIHILQRYAQSNLFDVLSERLNYIYYTNVFPMFIKKIKDMIHITNPDTFMKGYYIYKDKMTDEIYFFVLFFNKKKKMMQRKTFIYNAKLAVWQFSDFIPFKGKISQYEHPYEVISIIWTENIFK